MSSGMQTILAAIAGGTVVAIINGYFNYFTLRNQRVVAEGQWSHERLAAAEARVAEQRGRAYVDAMLCLQPLYEAAVIKSPTPQEWKEGLETTHGWDPPGDVMARLRVYGSAEAAEHFRNAYGSLRESLRITVHKLELVGQAEIGVLPDLDQDIVKSMQKESERAQGHGLASYAEFDNQVRADLMPRGW